MTHREKMDYLKENDPMLYYELTSNPTGADSDSGEFGCVLGFILIVIAVCFVAYMFCGK